MALQRRHTDASKPYDPSKDLSTNQLKRYSEVANQAEEKRKQRELYKMALNPAKARAEAVAKARAQMMAKIKQEPEEKKKIRMPELTFLRVLIWSFVLGSFWLWVLFMFPSQ